MTSAVILGMVVTLFTEPRWQARAIGIYRFVAAAGASIGLPAGGFLTDALNWHWIFLANIPIGVITAVLALRSLEADRAIELGKGADALGPTEKAEQPAPDASERRLGDRAFPVARLHQRA